METTTIAGLFRQWDNAANAIDLLSSAGFSADQISLIVSKKVADDNRNRSRPLVQGTNRGLTADAAMAGGGSATVGSMDNMLAGGTPLAAAGIGNVFFAGALADGSRQAAAGTEVETHDKDVFRSLTDAGIPPDRAEVFAEGIKRGFVLVGVTSEDRSAEAINWLNQANAADVEAVRREWEREGWTGFARNT
jgi:hypothetical protein